MELISQRVKADRKYYWVGIDEPDKVFIPDTAHRNDESKYQRFLKIPATSKKDAIQQVTLMLVEGRYRIIVDSLWAWR